MTEVKIPPDIMKIAERHNHERLNLTDRFADLRAIPEYSLACDDRDALLKHWSALTQRVSELEGKQRTPHDNKPDAMARSALHKVLDAARAYQSGGLTVAELTAHYDSLARAIREYDLCAAQPNPTVPAKGKDATACAYCKGSGNDPIQGHPDHRFECVRCNGTGISRIPADRGV